MFAVITRSQPLSRTPPLVPYLREIYAEKEGTYSCVLVYVSFNFCPGCVSFQAATSGAGTEFELSTTAVTVQQADGGLLKGETARRRDQEGLQVVNSKVRCSVGVPLVLNELPSRLSAFNQTLKGGVIGLNCILTHTCKPTPEAGFRSLLFSPDALGPGPLHVKGVHASPSRVCFFKALSLSHAVTKSKLVASSDKQV